MFIRSKVALFDVQESNIESDRVFQKKIAIYLVFFFKQKTAYEF